MNETITIKYFMLEATIQEMQDRGERITLLDRCQDREFCQRIGVDYNSKDIYQDIKLTILDYKSEK